MGFWKSSLEDLVMSTQFWKDKTILLTGHTGFKGSWLSLWLQQLGVNLVGYSKDIPTKPSLFEVAHVEDKMKSIIGNVCDFENLSNVISTYQPEIIIHMAAQAIVRESYKNPVETYATNVMGTVNLLESIRRNGGTRILVNVTSDKCYEPKKLTGGYKESDPKGGYDPYSSSKGCAELVTSAFRNSFFNPTKYENHGVALASCRAGNVIGGGDWAIDRLIPDIIKGFLEGKETRIRNPNAIRPWQHVLEPLSGYLLLAEKLWDEGSKFSEGWNFGPSQKDEKPVKWILKILNEQLEGKIKWFLDETKNPHEEKILRLDCAKAISKLGWSPKMSLENALRWTSDWYKHYKNKEDMRKYTEKQIEQFTLLKA